MKKPIRSRNVALFALLAIGGAVSFVWLSGKSIFSSKKTTAQAPISATAQVLISPQSPRVSASGHF